MPNPFQMAPASDFIESPITEPQRRYLRDLMMQKAALTGVDDPDAETKLDSWLDGLSKAGASAQIEEQKAAVYQLRSRSQDLDLEGFWELADGSICKVQRAVHGSGNLYAKQLDPTTGEFSYVRGLVGRLPGAGTRLTLERAKELGHLYGMCIRCGATLTDEASIAAGIGPVCATKF